MREITKETVTEVKHTVTKYVADDGTEFNNFDKCQEYEVGLKVNSLADKYGLRRVTIPYFIGGDGYSCGYFLSYPNDGTHDEFVSLIECLIYWKVRKYDEGWKVEYPYDFSNVRGDLLSLDTIRQMQFEKNQSYLFYFNHEHEYESWDIYYKALIDKKTAKVMLEEQVRQYKNLFEED